MPNQEIQLDHIVLLLPYKDMLEPPAWITEHFSVSPGGTHSDGKTANKLILFQDGTYLELISFIDDDPARREGHVWDKEFGIIDYALTTPGRLDYESFMSRLNSSKSSIRYGAPQGGGRKTAAGVDLKWEITSALGVGRGYVPFFCNDVTDRNLRVDPQGKLAHPSRAIGVAEVIVNLKAKVEEIASANAAITNDRESQDGVSHLSVPRKSENFHASAIRSTTGEDLAADLRIDLVIKTEGKPPSPIKHHVGNGSVSISFVQ